MTSNEWRVGGTVVVGEYAFIVVDLRPGWRGRGLRAAYASRDGKPVIAHLTCECAGKTWYVGVVELVTEERFAVCAECRRRKT